MATTQARDKYYLRTLHEEIGLFDRKLAHMAKYDSFGSDKERDTAAHKLTAKRELLVRTAKQLVEEGIEYKASEMPRSLRPEGEHAEVEAAPALQEVVATPATPQDRPAITAFDGTVMNFRQEIKEYMEKRKKTLASSTHS